MILENRYEEEESVEADTVVVALGREPVNDLYQQMNGRERAVYIIGDAKEVRSMPSATHEGFWVGRIIE